MGRCVPDGLGDHRPVRPPHRPSPRSRLGAIADLGFVGLDDSGPDGDPAVITGYKAARNRPLTRSHKRSNKRWPPSGHRSSTASHT